MKQETIIQSLAEDFSNGDLNTFRDAIYMISDAKEKLASLKQNLKDTNKWGRVGDINHTIDQLDELMGTKEDGCGLSNYYKVL